MVCDWKRAKRGISQFAANVGMTSLTALRRGGLGGFRYQIPGRGQSGQIQTAGFGQCQSARQAPGQPHPEIVSQEINAAAPSWHGQVHDVGCVGETAGPRHHNERFDGSSRKPLDATNSGPDQIVIRTPNSTTRSLGMRKNSVAGTALRAMTRNKARRHQDSLGAMPGTRTSRPRK
jgi:hypothetical protein